MFMIGCVIVSIFLDEIKVGEVCVEGISCVFGCLGWFGWVGWWGWVCGCFGGGIIIVCGWLGIYIGWFWWIEVGGMGDL